MALTTAVFVNLKPSSTVKAAVCVYGIIKHTPILSHQHTHAHTCNPAGT